MNVQDIMDSAYTSSNKIGTAFGVASDRVAITASADNVPCLTVRSDYLSSSRSSAFLVGDDGALKAIDHC